MLKALNILAWIVFAVVVFAVVDYWSDLKWAYQNRATLEKTIAAGQALESGNVSGAVSTLQGLL